MTSAIWMYMQSLPYIQIVQICDIPKHLNFDSDNSMLMYSFIICLLVLYIGYMAIKKYNAYKEEQKFHTPTKPHKVSTVPNAPIRHHKYATRNTYPRAQLFAN